MIFIQFCRHFEESWTEEQSQKQKGNTQEIAKDRRGLAATRVKMAATPGDINLLMADPDQNIPATKVELTVSAR